MSVGKDIRLVNFAIMRISDFGTVSKSAMLVRVLCSSKLNLLKMTRIRCKNQIAEYFFNKMLEKRGRNKTSRFTNSQSITSY